MRVLQKAVLLAIKDSLNLNLDGDLSPIKRAYAVKITLGERAYNILLNRAMLLKFAADFLGEHNPQERLLIDIACEMTNLILGKAKVLYEENGEIFKLGMPEFLGIRLLKQNGFGYKFKNCKIGIYELN